MTTRLSDAAKRRIVRVPGEPLFYASWDEVVMIHYQVAATALQRLVPFELDLYERRAFVSLVGFTLRGMRPRRGGRIAEWLLKPIGTHEFMNVRTYVRVNGEPGIYFLAEWLSNRLSVPLGPSFFGLPYRYGRINYHHDRPEHGFSGCVTARGGCLYYYGALQRSTFAACEPGSLAEFLMERYTAVTQHRRWRRMFRVWHEPWPQAPADANVTAHDLLGTTGPWWQTAQYVSAHYSPGVDVWMGRPLWV